MKSMTIGNIVGGFRVAGIYPIDRSVFAELTGSKESLTTETGLAFIPLYSPARHPRKVTSGITSFSEEEITKFERRFENGYDILDDERYKCWLRRYHPAEFPLRPPVGGGDVSTGESLTYQSPSLLNLEEDHMDRVLMPTAPTASISKFLHYPSPPSQLPTLKPKSSGRVLTSAENLKMIEQKQQEKEAKAKQKEERRRKREEKARNRAEAVSGGGRRVCGELSSNCYTVWKCFGDCCYRGGLISGVVIRQGPTVVVCASDVACFWIF